MAELKRADAATVERIIRDTYSIWNEGLTLDGYRRWNDVQTRTAWGRQHLWRVALVDENEILASAKWYEIQCGSGFMVPGSGFPVPGSGGRVPGSGGRVPGSWSGFKVLGIGAVFTPEAQRGRGRATELIARMIEQAERDGYHAAVLFSEIGADIYERMGFTVIPRDAVALDVKFPKQGPPATLVRAGEDADLRHLAELHTGGAFGPIRTADLIKFSVVKRRARAALAHPGARTVEFFVSEEGHRPVAYVLISRGPSGNAGDGAEVMWLEACADRDPSGARVGAMLQVLRARTMGEAWPKFCSWLPDGWLPPQLEIVGRAPAEDIMMIRPLGNNVLPPMKSGDVEWWHADYF